MKQPFIRTKNSMRHRDDGLDNVFKILIGSKMFSNRTVFHEDLNKAYKDGDRKTLDSYIDDSECELKEIGSLSINFGLPISKQGRVLRQSLKDFKAFLERQTNANTEERKQMDKQAESLLRQINLSATEFLLEMSKLKEKNEEYINKDNASSGHSGRWGKILKMLDNELGPKEE